ncbi:response regulator transcription factor [Thiohalophilus thiocyanatoxydans]|uniref:Phosphate regulon transcriptional regulatory protein PhoB n=1 Tax=Thiohalophilus thiocyanatoxydans TaxID=381308 RepID=A0A4R8IG68_9GAMM|nr:response regulator transcription factor [Thiohalophilus thiocyanatoxydans]TDX99551.1 DNA-binding response OmpR family regulator [Thiohalophilus thiocyanatoxydans]
MSRRVLVIEDNRDIAGLVRMNLRDLSTETDVAYSGREGMKMAHEGNYNLVILDLMLPDMDGIEICRTLRNDKSYLPILMLTARTSELDRVLGLETGADDYLTKPFSIRELIARVKAIFRRMDAMVENGTTSESLIQRDGLVIDCEKHEVDLDGKPVTLTSREFDLLVHFARHPGRVYRREQLLDQVWGYGYDGYEHTVNSHINRLRTKIESDPTKPRYILTVWGVGYKFAEH